MTKEEIVNLSIKCYCYIKRAYPDRYLDYIDRTYWPEIVRQCDPKNPDIWKTATDLYNLSKNRRVDQIFYLAAALIKTSDL